MREILFRGKDKDGNCVYGDLIHGYIAIETVNDTVEEWPDPIPVSIKEENCFPVEVIPETVGQMYKKGTHTFFGGDLFYALASPSGKKFKRTMLCHVVDSDEGMDVVVWHNGEWWAYSFIDFTTTNIVGNIHDNPELLNQ